MSSLGALLLVLAGAGSDGSEATASVPKTSATADAPPALRKGHELRDAVRSALRRWARPSDDDAPQAAREFLVLYQEFQADQQLARAQREPLRPQVRNRLVQLSDQISSRIARERRLAGQDRPKSVDAPPDKTAPLAQQLGGPAARGNRAGGRNRGPGSGGQEFLPDAGQDLVDLIQRVIAPSSWDVNGGPGSIYYWRPRRALVVRQTAEVHERISDMLEQMERLGR